MNELVCIKRFLLHEDYYFEGVKIVSYHIVYPQFISQTPIFHTLNKQYYLNALKKKEYCANVLYPETIQAFLQGSKAFPYEMIVTITITLQTEQIASFYQQEYLYTGGANGHTTRVSQTINTLTGHIMKLCDFLQNKDNCETCVKNNIIKQIKTSDNSSIYFDNYPSLVKETFHPQNFYLTSEGVVVFFALYDIAPHSTGIPTFLIPYFEC